MEQLEPSVKLELGQARKLHGPDSEEALLATGKYARLLFNMGELGKAEGLRREELAGRQRVQGMKHPDALIAMGNLAAVLRGRGKLAESEALC